MVFFSLGGQGKAFAFVSWSCLLTSPCLVWLIMMWMEMAIMETKTGDGDWKGRRWLLIPFSRWLLREKATQAPSNGGGRKTREILHKSPVSRLKRSMIN
ncbi:hypothetical protein BU24DRAFT_427516 [Aaosphaeria arxii CBS 175.79]|uniref:Uncharacterized protein n=1 Tax=Aaosphaeria arxii CBS 175.79 TaxID=1450172 RepID=A0A6A5XC38_9PLEO|nr:uncharacterized protein BU24DRAFT_427516 [Aaosphaeria arxii CBS 175.79]KAF2010386.1 hypothetical protein BU24DRAFT_427516 [Aaosphaeria arxii CBS 175.79]